MVRGLEGIAAASNSWELAPKMGHGLRVFWAPENAVEPLLPTRFLPSFRGNIPSSAFVLHILGFEYDRMSTRSSGARYQMVWTSSDISMLSSSLRAIPKSQICQGNGLIENEKGQEAGIEEEKVNRREIDPCKPR